MDSNQYNDIYELVKKGFTIQKACKRVGILTSEYYKDATEEQKAEMRFIKTTTLNAGVPGHASFSYDTKNLNYEDEY